MLRGEHVMEFEAVSMRNRIAYDLDKFIDLENGVHATKLFNADTRVRLLKQGITQLTYARRNNRTRLTPKAKQILRELTQDD